MDIILNTRKTPTSRREEVEADMFSGSQHNVSVDERACFGVATLGLGAQSGSF